MSEDNIQFCERQGIDAYLAVGRITHGPGGDQEAPPHEKRLWRAMRQKLSTEQGRQIYSRRKVIAEPVFGQAKEARGFRRFSSSCDEPSPASESASAPDSASRDL